MKLGVIGGGFGVDGYLASLASIPDIEVTAVADSGSGRVVERLPSQTFYEPSWRNLLHSSIDVVCIVTPPVTHREIVLAFLDCGKHIICEKPFGVDIEQSHEMFDLSVCVEVVAAVTFQYRFEPGFQALKMFLNEGYMGELQSMKCTWLTSGRRDPQSYWTWRNSAAHGGGVIGAFLSHVVDLFQWLSGAQVQQVQASADILVPQRILADGSFVDVTAEDQVQAFMTLENGVTASCHISNCYPRTLGMRMELICGKGRLVYTHTPPFTASTQEIYLHTANTAPQRLFNAKDVLGCGGGDTRLLALRGFFECFMRGISGHETPNMPSFESGLDVQRVLHAVRQSAVTQKRVSC